METTSFDLMPEQKILVVALAQETGKPVPVLIAEALDALPGHVHATQATYRGNGEREKPVSSSLPPGKKPLWEIAAECMAEMPEEDLATSRYRATQHDHAIYGTPKRRRVLLTERPCYGRRD